MFKCLHKLYAVLGPTFMAVTLFLNLVTLAVPAEITLTYSLKNTGATDVNTLKMYHH